VGLAAVHSQRVHHASSASVSSSSSFAPSRSSVAQGLQRGFFTTPDCLFLVWSLSWSEVDDHRWMCQLIEDELYLMRESPESDTFL